MRKGDNLNRREREAYLYHNSELPTWVTHKFLPIHLLAIEHFAIVVSKRQLTIVVETTGGNSTNRIAAFDIVLLFE